MRYVNCTRKTTRYKLKKSFYYIYCSLLQRTDLFIIQMIKGTLVDKIFTLKFYVTNYI